MITWSTTPFDPLSEWKQVAKLTLAQLHFLANVLPMQIFEKLMHCTSKWYKQQKQEIANVRFT